MRRVMTIRDLVATGRITLAVDQMEASGDADYRRALVRAAQQEYVAACDAKIQQAPAA